MAVSHRKRRVDLPRRREAEKKQSPKEEKRAERRSFGQETVTVFLLLIGTFLCFALGSKLFFGHTHLAVSAPSLTLPPQNIMGYFGEKVSALLVFLLGWCSFITVFWTALLARTVWQSGWFLGSRSSLTLIASTISFLLMAVACAAVVALFFGIDGGGIIGAKLAAELVRYLNKPGALLVSTAMFLVAFDYATGFGLSDLLSFFRQCSRWGKLLLTDAGYVLATALRVVFQSLAFITSLVFRTVYRLVLFILQGMWQVFTFPFRLLWPKYFSKTPSFFEELENDERPFTLGDEEVEATLKSKRLGKRRPRISRSMREKLAAKRRSKRQKPVALEKDVEEEEIQPRAVPRSPFKSPPVSFLISGESSPSTAPSDEELEENSKRLEQALADFRIGGHIVEVHPGPIITLYQFQPAAGIKVQRIINLADDLALALRVASVRVYAPVPGKGTVGIEVPNTEREIVRLRDIIESKEYKDSEASLTLALGKSTFGEPCVTDLARMPHLLIAGATGTGKSVCINSILLSLLYRNSPEDLQFILIDPKMLELSTYEDIPHLKAPVVTNPKRARGVLWWAVEEMDRRYQLMKDLGVRSFANYNRSVVLDETLLNGETGGTQSALSLTDAPIMPSLPDVAASEVKNGFHSTGSTMSAELRKKLERLPRIVIVVDELADLMLTVGREIEELLTRLAQKARAAGIHLILATQRPSVNVITGLIKANFPARISFQVASRIDARTVLDSSGAEKLLGQGDMLFLSPGSGRVTRMHSAFVSDQEVQDVVSWLRKQGRPAYDTKIEETIQRLNESEKSSGAEFGEGAEADPLYDQAVSLVIDKGHASTSMVQRAFRIGYNRAARMLEVMENEGVVGPADGAKPRQVLMGHARDGY